MFYPTSSSTNGNHEHHQCNISQAISDKGDWWQHDKLGVEDQHVTAADFEYLRHPEGRNYTVLMPLHEDLKALSDSAARHGVAVKDLADSLLLHVLIGRYTWQDLRDMIVDGRCELCSPLSGCVLLLLLYSAHDLPELPVVTLAAVRNLCTCTRTPGAVVLFERCGCLYFDTGWCFWGLSPSTFILVKR